MRILGLLEAGGLELVPVVGRVVGHHDGVVQVEAIHQETDHIVGGQVHGSPRHRLAFGLQPGAGSLEQGVGHRLVRDALVESEEPHVLVLGMELAVPVVAHRRDGPHHFRAPPGQEGLHLGVLEHGVLRGVQELLPFHHQGRHPVRLLAVEGEGELDEGSQVPGTRGGTDLHPGGHAPCSRRPKCLPAR